MAFTTGTFINYLFGLLLKKIVVPVDFHARALAVKEILEDDVSGIVDSLTDFAVSSATVEYAIETDNPKFTEKLQKWLDNINSPYKGKVPRGIKPLAKEYFQERWKGASFPILKITKWDRIEGITLPTKMFFVDGGCVYAEEKDADQEVKTLDSYDYFLGQSKEDKLDKGVIITKPFARWYEEYPNPYLIKRGIYHNWKIIQSLKKRESELLEQVIPYLLHIKKGTENLTLQDKKTYTNPELQEVVEDMQALVDKMNTIDTSAEGTVKSPIRVTQFDENITHLIPDLKAVFEQELFIVAEKNILSGLGFIDVIEGVSTSRRESILNPKAFIEEVKTGVEDFKLILNELIAKIIEVNKNHRKYVNTNFYIISSPVKAFMTDDFKEKVRQLYDRGSISKQTSVELIGEIDFKTEVHRRRQESTDGLDLDMYPPIIVNREDQGIDIPGETPEEETKDEVTDDKKGIEKDNYKIATYENPVKCSKCKNIFDYTAEVEIGMGAVACPKCHQAVTQKDLIKSKIVLETAPYVRITQLPTSVRKKLSPTKQRIWMDIFNDAYRNHLKKFGDAKKAETYAFKTAWSKIKNVKSKKRGKKND